MCLSPQRVREVEPVSGEALDAMLQLDRTARMPDFIDSAAGSSEILRALKVGVDTNTDTETPLPPGS